MGFLLITSDFIRLGASETNILKNSPYMITFSFLVSYMFGIFIISYVASNSAYRDIRDKTYEFIFTSPIRKSEYFFGRLVGSFVISLAILIFILIGQILGNFAPWVDKEKLGPMNLYHYLNPILQFGIPNTFLFSSLFFGITAATRKEFIAYLGGVLFFALWIVSSTLMGILKLEKLSIYLDPFGFSAFSETIKYWTSAQLNTQSIPWSMSITFNRILWLLVGIVILFVSYRFFNLKEKEEKGRKLVQEEIKVYLEKPKYVPSFNILKFIIHTALFEIKYLRRSYAILGIILVSIIVLIPNLYGVNIIYDTPVYPTTSLLTSVIQGNVLLFYMILTTLIAGEIINRDKDNLTSEMLGTSPMFPYLLLGRFIGMLIFLGILIFVYIICGVVYQAINGYYRFEIFLYIKRLMLEPYLTIVYLSTLSLLIHSIVRNKFVGHMLFMGYLLGILFISNLETKIFQYSIIRFPFYPLIEYSDFFGYGHFIKTLLAYRVYWGGLSLIFITLAFLLYTENFTGFKGRLKKMLSSINIKNGAVLALSFVVFVVSGIYLWYNHYVFNRFLSREESRRMRVKYEKLYSKYEYMPLPKITDVFLRVDIYPKRRSVYTYGKFWVENKISRAISRLFVNIPAKSETHKKLEFIRFSVPVKEIHKDKELGVVIYEFVKPLKPGDRFYVEFKISCEPKGIIDGFDTRCGVFENGTFLSGNYPIFGYMRDREIKNRNLRKKYGLPPKDAYPDIDDPRISNITMINDADWVNFEAVVSTSANQVALAPGELVGSWEEGNRRFFKYKSLKPILHIYAFVSGKYSVVSDNYGDVKLYIYYLPSHDFNVKRILKGMKESLKFSERFSPYPHKTLRIVEFPRFGRFAQSLATLIPFSEDIGFLAKVKEGDIDYATFVTSHEVGHQWWAHQVISRFSKGIHFLSESFAEYTGIRVMENIYGDASKFLKHEIDRYLKGRKMETYKETPLYLSEGQAYIHYNKGGLINYSTADYIGKERFDSLLREFVNKYSYKHSPYPSSKDFLSMLYEIVPDTLLEQIKGWYEDIIIYDFGVKKFRWENGKAFIEYEFRKFRYDSVGNRYELKPNDVVEIGFYKDGKVKELRRIRIRESFGKLIIPLTFKPEKVMLDPTHKLINLRLSE